MSTNMVDFQASHVWLSEGTPNVWRYEGCNYIVHGVRSQLITGALYCDVNQMTICIGVSVPTYGGLVHLIHQLLATSGGGDESPRLWLFDARYMGDSAAQGVFWSYGDGWKDGDLWRYKTENWHMYKYLLGCLSRNGDFTSNKWILINQDKV
jgi:hypothetical protein